MLSCCENQWIFVFVEKQVVCFSRWQRKLIGNTFIASCQVLCLKVKNILDI